MYVVPAAAAAAAMWRRGTRTGTAAQRGRTAYCCVWCVWFETIMLWCTSRAAKEAIVAARRGDVLPHPWQVCHKFWTGGGSARSTGGQRDECSLHAARALTSPATPPQPTIKSQQQHHTLRLHGAQLRTTPAPTAPQAARPYTSLTEAHPRSSSHRSRNSTDVPSTGCIVSALCAWAGRKGPSARCQAGRRQQQQQLSHTPGARRCLSAWRRGRDQLRT